MGQTNPDRGSTQKVHQPIHTDKEQTFHRSRTKVQQGGNLYSLIPVTLHSRLSLKAHPYPHRAQTAKQTSKMVSGGGGRDRTDDPLLAKQVLSQLSYAPKV